MRAAEKKVTTREQVLALVEQNSAEHLVWIDALTHEQIISTVTIPFEPMPMAVGIILPANHIRYHTAQLNYMQTIYDDLDWHMSS